MRLVLLSSLLLVACGSPQRPPSIGNQATAAPPSEPACAPGLRGTVVDSQRQPVIGATVVVSGAGTGDDDFPMVVTDEQGRFAFPSVDAMDRLTLYYEDTTYDGALPRGCDAVVIAIGERGSPGDSFRFTLLSP